MDWNNKLRGSYFGFQTVLNKSMSEIFQKAATSIGIALVSAALTFGITAKGSLVSMEKAIAVQEQKLDHLHQADASTNGRIDHIVPLFEKLIEQNTELITLVRVQNQMQKSP